MNAQSAMRRKKSTQLFITFILTVLVGAYSTKCEAQVLDSTSAELPSPRGALLRSVVLPGWGQFYTKHYLKSAGFFGTHIYFVYRFNELHMTLGTIDNETDKNHAKYERNTWAWRFLAAYVLNLADAYVDAHLAGFPDPEESLGIHLRADVPPMIVRFTYSF